MIYPLPTKIKNTTKDKNSMKNSTFFDTVTNSSSLSRMTLLNSSISSSLNNKEKRDC